MTPDEQTARNRRNLMIALALGAFVVLVFLVTVAQLRAGVHAHP